ncbi:MAG: hypothetical protein ACR2IE_12295 [Candidatus Sumerlaeaceae bacterium]
MADYDRTTSCSLLRSKNMYAHVDPAHRAHSTSEITEPFWCNLTMTNIGPDEKLCDETQCCKGRWCYRNILDV